MAGKRKTKEVSMEEALWKSADKLRGSVEPSEYKHVVLSLFFLKFASDKFEEQRSKLKTQGMEKFIDNIAFYTKDNAIEEFKRVNRIKSIEFSDRMRAVVDIYNNRRRDEAFANEVLDDVANQLADLLHELKKEKNSFENMGIDYEEKAFYDILLAVAKKYDFEYPDDKMVELSKEIKVVVDDKAKYTDWATREDIKANLQVDLILLLDKYGYPPVTIDDVYKEVLEQAENFKKYAK